MAQGCAPKMLGFWKHVPEKNAWKKAPRVEPCAREKTFGGGSYHPWEES